MVTTIQIDSYQLYRFREAIEKKYGKGKIRGNMGNEIRDMFEERIEKLNR